MKDNTSVLEEVENMSFEKGQVVGAGKDQLSEARFGTTSQTGL